MKIVKLFFIIFCFTQILNTLNAQENSSVHQHWTKEYSDPVELTKELIRKTEVFWTPLGKTTLVLTYKVGFTTARFGGRYILLESPNIVIDLAKGGIYEAIGSIAYDGMLDIIKRSIKSPDKLCESIAWSLIKQGLDEYEISYSIARKYIETRELNITEAMDFLKNRWGVFKLGIARQLYLDSQKKYSIDEQLAERAIKEVLDKFEDIYKSRLDMNDNLPLMDAAFFIKDLFDIIEQKKIGLANYEPYLKFNERIEELNRIRIEEIKRLFSGKYSKVFTFNLIKDKTQRHRIYLGGSKFDVVFKAMEGTPSFWTELEIICNGQHYNLYDRHIGYHGPGKNQIGMWTKGVEIDFSEDPLGTKRPFQLKAKLISKDNYSAIIQLELDASKTLLDPTIKTVEAYYVGMDAGDLIHVFFRDKQGNPISFDYDYPDGVYLIINQNKIKDKLLTIKYTTVEEFRRDLGFSIELDKIISVTFNNENSIDWWLELENDPETMKKYLSIAEDYVQSLWHRNY